MIWQWMRNGFFRFLVQIARDWTGFWGFDGCFRCICDIFGGYEWGEETGSFGVGAYWLRRELLTLPTDKYTSFTNTRR